MVTLMTVTFRPVERQDAGPIRGLEQELARTPGGLASRPHEVVEPVVAPRITVRSAKTAQGWLVAESEGLLVGHRKPGFVDEGQFVRWSKRAPDDDVDVRSIGLRVRPWSTFALALLLCACGPDQPGVEGHSYLELARAQGAMRRGVTEGLVHSRGITVPFAEVEAVLWKGQVVSTTADELGAYHFPIASTEVAMVRAKSADRLGAYEVYDVDEQVDVELRTPWIITGHVRSEAGVPVSGVELAFSARYMTCGGLSEGAPVAVAHTDAEGWFWAAVPVAEVLVVLTRGNLMTVESFTLAGLGPRVERDFTLQHETADFTRWHQHAARALNQAQGSGPRAKVFGARGESLPHARTGSAVAPPWETPQHGVELFVVWARARGFAFRLSEPVAVPLESIELDPLESFSVFVHDESGAPVTGCSLLSGAETDAAGEAWWSGGPGEPRAAPYRCCEGVVLIPPEAGVVGDVLARPQPCPLKPSG